MALQQARAQLQGEQAKLASALTQAKLRQAKVEAKLKRVIGDLKTVKGAGRVLPPTSWTWRVTVAAGRWAKWRAENVDIPATLVLGRID